MDNGSSEVAALIERLEAEKQAAGGEQLVASEQVLRFQLGSEQYGLPIEQIKSISRLRPITYVPGTASYVLGVSNQAGTVIPVIALGDLLGKGGRETSRDSRIVTLHTRQEESEFELGLLVDRVVDVLTVPVNAVEPPLVTLERSSNFLRGQHRVQGGIVLLIDLPAMLRLITNRAGMV